MKLHLRAIVLGALTLLVVPNAVEAGAPARRFASPNADVLEQLCHRVHLLPVDSLHRARALQSCKNLQETVPHQFQSGPTKDKVEYGKVLEGEKAKYITKTQNREPTPQELAGLKALDEAQAKAKKVVEDIAAAAATRKSEAAAANQQALIDQLARQEQVRQQLDDHLKTLLNERNKNAAADAVRQDQLDVDAVANAKAKLAEYEKSIASAKASSAADAKVLESYDAKLKEVQANWKRDAAQRKADFAEGENDKKLADDAAKAARAKVREDRAKEMDMRAKQREQDMTTARAERDAALKRQRLVNEEAEVRAKLKTEQEDAEAALVKNRKNRKGEEAERQKQMDAYAKEEANIKTRREEFEKVEKEREIRAKKRADDEELRRKAKEEEELRLAKAREDAAPHEERSKQDDEDDCTDKSVSCGSGKCFQLKSDPKSKRCQCQKGDKGKNCEHTACEYDLDDGAGKKKKQAGNMVNGQCVRWKAVYRCTCDKPWRLDVACVKKQGMKEIEVPRTDCKGLREPENEYADQICKLCPCKIGRGLASNTTADDDHIQRSLLGGCEPIKTCVSPTPGTFTLAPGITIPAQLGAGAIAENVYTLPKVVEESTAANDKMFATIKVESNKECLSKCLERNGQTNEKASVARFTMSSEWHCTWFFVQNVNSGSRKCYLFYTGEFPEQVPPPPPPSPKTGDKRKRIETGFLGFVTYPRRWDLFREVSTSESKRQFCESRKRFAVHFGRFPGATVGGSPLTDLKEGMGTYVRALDSFSGDGCIGAPRTVLENALIYAPQAKTLAPEAVDVPPKWTDYDTKYRLPATVTSKASATQEKWTYTVDHLFRVVKVQGISKELDSTSRNEAKDKQFQGAFNWLTARMYHEAKLADFCAGHLVGHKQMPPNFYFNFVPQSPNSNTNGCWFRAEMAAANLLQLGCHLQYNIDVDYGKHGAQKPSAIKEGLDDWARERHHSNPRTKRIISYVNDDLKCHYRYRPYIMNLEFQVVNADPNTHCVNLRDALTAGAQKTMLRVDGDRVISTRVFAYLIEKQKERGLETGKGGKSLNRFFGAATTLKKELGSDRSCYAETGNNADFQTLEMDLAFSDAYLGDKRHTDCIRGSVATECGKWSMTPNPNTPDSGRLLSPDGECLWFDKSKLNMVDPGTSTSNCATFKYVVGGTSFTRVRWTTAFLGNRRSIEHLVLGTIHFDDQHCVGKNMEVVTPDIGAKNCLHLRVNYYTSTPKKRRLAATVSGEDVDGDEDVNADTGEDDGGEDVEEPAWTGVCAV